MADFSKYTDMPLAANAADFAMEEYEAYEARKQLLDLLSVVNSEILSAQTENQLDRTIQPFMEMAEYMAMKMFEAGWKAAKAEK